MIFAIYEKYGILIPMILINSFVIKKSIMSRSGFRPMASFLHTIVLPKTSYPYSAFALSNYMFVQFWYCDEQEHSVKVIISTENKKEELEVDSYNLPQKEADKRVFQQTLILPRIIVSEPQTIWISTYCDGNKTQEYPIEFLHK